MFNEELLYDYNTKLYYHLIELFDTNKCTLCLFFFYDEYHYGGRDWSTGYTWDVSLSLSLSEQMKYEEELEKQIFSEKKKSFI